MQAGGGKDGIGRSLMCVDVMMELLGCSTVMGCGSGCMFWSGALTEKKVPVVPVSRTAWVEGGGGARRVR